MMDVARAKFFPHEQVTFQIADATALPFDDEAFDAVVCQFGVMFFDKDTAFSEVHRTLKGGGSIPVQCLGLPALQSIRQRNF